MSDSIWSARVERAAAGLALAAVGGLLLLAAGTAVDVLLRFVFASPIRGFVDIASLTGASLRIVSVGPRREQTMFVD